MPWSVILPIAASIIQGAVGQGMAANSAARENQRQSQIMSLRRQELQPIIDRLREARNYFGVEETLVRDFSRSADQMAAQSAQTGMTNAGSGGLDNNRADLLGSLLSGLAEYKNQDEMQRQQMLAALLSDPTMYGGMVGTDDPTQAGLMGGLGGGLAGLGSALNSFISTPEGMAALGSLFGDGEVGTVEVDEGVSTAGQDAGWNFLMGGQNRAPTAPAPAARAPYLYNPRPAYFE